MTTTHQYRKNTTDNFIDLLNELAQDSRNKDLQQAIDSWCDKLSINDTIPGASPKEISNYINQWITDSSVTKLALKLYQKMLAITNNNFQFLGLRVDTLGVIENKLSNISQNQFKHNIKETKNNMTIKPILLIAFVLTGVGLLLFILNNKKSINSKNKYSRNYTNSIPRQTPSIYPKKSILTLVINADKYQDLISSLKNNNHITSTDSKKLSSATQSLWIANETEFNRSPLSQKFKHNEISNKSEYDVYLVKIELERSIPGFERNANLMDRKDAFSSLNGNKVTVSSRLSSKAYEHSQLYKL